MRIGDKLISNTFYFFLDWFVLSSLSFIFWLILAKTLKTFEYGIVSASVSFIALISGVTALGIPQAISKLIPEYLERRGLNYVYSLVKISIKPVVISLTILSFILFLFSNQISSFLKVPKDAFLVIIFSIISLSSFDFFGHVIYGFQNMRKFFLTNFYQSSIKIVISIILILFGFTYLGPLIGLSLSLLIAFFFRIDLNYFKKNIFIPYKVLFDYAIPVFISTIAFSFITFAPNIILIILKTAEITGVFAVALTISMIISTIPAIFSAALFPIISSLHVYPKTKGEQGYLIGLVLRYSLFLIFPISILLLIFSKYAVLLFSRTQFLQATIYFPILIPTAIASGIGKIFISNLYAIGKPKIYRNIMVSTAFLFLFLSIPLTNYFSALGLSIAYFITMFSFFLLSFLCLRKYLKIVIFGKDIFKTFIASLLIALLLLYLRQFVHNLLTLITISIPIGLVYLFLLLISRFYRQDDIKLLNFFAERIPILRKYILILIKILKKHSNADTSYFFK